ncbi:MAG: hypothetical protein ACR2LQ_13735 [Acidimicrobiales bacterium]
MAAAAFLVLGIGWNALQAWQQGWIAEGDSAIIALRTDDVLTAHPPLLGNPTTAGTSTAQDAYHPGPLEFELLALPLRVWAPSTLGLLVGVALVNAAAIVLLVLFAHRRGGGSAALAAAAWAAILVFGLGEEIPHDAYNPHIVLIPLALLGVLAWSILCLDDVAIPLAVAVGSLVAQSHAYEVLMVAGMLLLVIVGRCVQRSRPRGRWLGAAVLTGFVLWLPPIIDQLSNKPGNLRVLFDEARSSGGETEGWGFAWRGLADAITPPFRWLIRQPSWADTHPDPGMARAAVALAVLVAMIVVAVRSRRAGDRAAFSLIVTALGALAVSAATAARLPTGIASAAPYNHRHWWVTGSLAWFALVWGVAALHRERLPRAIRLAGFALTAFVVVLTGSQVTVGDDRGSASFGALAALERPVVAAARDKGPVVVVGRGAQAFTSIEPGLVAVLTLHGIDARVLGGEAKIFGARRVGGVDIVTWLYVVSGEGVDAAPPGSELVARYDPSADVASGFSNAGVSGKAEPIAVYVGPPG